MAKPKIKNPRKHRVTVRMNDAEYQAFLKNCDIAELSGADLFRVLCCGREVTKPRRRLSVDREALNATAAQLIKIGSNINQMAHAVNIAKLQPNVSAAVAATLDVKAAELAAASAQLAQLRALISKALSYDTGSEQD